MKIFSEIVYGKAIKIEFKNTWINHKRKVKLDLDYKRNLLPYFYYIDYIIDNKIVLEINAIGTLTKSHKKQVLNYVAVLKIKLGLWVNFIEDSLNCRRILL